MPVSTWRKALTLPTMAMLLACLIAPVVVIAAVAGIEEATKDRPYWWDIHRSLPITPGGNRVALSCHNCYGASNAATKLQVAMALEREMDLVEFDLTQHADGHIYIEHIPGQAARGTLQEALSEPGLQQSDRMLFLEIKAPYSTVLASDALMLRVLRMLRDQHYAAPGRPAVLRAFMDETNRHQHLVRAKYLLTAAEFADIRPHVRFHSLIGPSPLDSIRATRWLGFHGVELPYQLPDLSRLLKQARELGLGVGVFTVPERGAPAIMVALRENVDFITTDYDRSADAHPLSARQIISAVLSTPPSAAVP